MVAGGKDRKRKGFAAEEKDEKEKILLQKKGVDKKNIIAYNRLHHEYDKNNEGNK